jgi:protein-arginine kinase activator protein McsA
MEITRWCEECSNAEALIRVTEEIEGQANWVHSWCIECAKNKVLTNGEWSAKIDIPHKVIDLGHLDK